MRDQFPAIDPYDSGMLDVSDGLQILEDAGHGDGDTLTAVIVDALTECANDVEDEAARRP
jgi:hypothetical protein